MAVLSLDSGKPDKSVPQREDEQAGTIIGNVLDLETGKPVSVQPQAKPKLQIGEPISIPDSATTQFPAKREETRAAAELPEIGEGGLLFGEDKLKVAGIAPVLLTTTNPQEMANILKNTFPEAIGIQYDEGGNIIAANNKTGGRVILNRPGLSQIDVLQGLGITAAFMPAGSVSGLATKTLPKVALGAVAAGATQTGIEAIQEQLGGELNEEEIAISSALGGVAETVIPAIQALRQQRQAARLGVERADVARSIQDVKPAREAQAALQAETGITVPLFQAQQTQQPSALLRQRILPQLDAGSRKAALELENQNKAAFDATVEMVNSVSGPESLETGSKGFRTAAQKAIDSAKQSRAAATRDLYEEALDAGADVDLTSVKSLIDELLKDAPPSGEYEKVANKLLAKIQPRKEGEKVSLRQLQKAKIEMHDMLEAVGDKAVSAGLKREIAQVKTQLIADMSEASPLFKAADDEFARLSPAVQELTDSVLGAVSKVNDSQLKSIAGKIFDAQQTDPSIILRAKKLIDQADPNAWNALLRVEFQRRIGGIKELAEDMPGELVGNVPGQLRRALFGNPSQRKVLLAGMTPEQRKNFMYLDDVLRRASSGRQAGSPSAAFGQAIDKIRGTFGVIRDIVLSPKQTVAGVGFDARVSKLADVMFNPKWEPKLKQLRALPPQSKEAAAIMSSLLGAAKAGTQTYRQSQEQQ